MLLDWGENSLLLLLHNSQQDCLVKVHEDKLLTISGFGINDRNIFVIVNTVIAVSPFPGLSLLVPFTLVLPALGNPCIMVTQSRMKE